MCGLAVVCVSVRVVCVCAYCIGSVLQWIFAFCSVTVPIIGTLQLALAMDGYNVRVVHCRPCTIPNYYIYTAPKHYNARQLSTHLIFTAIISSMVLTEDSIITNHHCPYAPSHATEEQQTEGEMG